MSAVSLLCSNTIHDTFLHVSPSLYLKIFTQLTPLVELSADNKRFTFWCVKDSSLSDKVVNLNCNFAEKIGFKMGGIYKVALGPFQCVSLSKVIVSLPNSKDDWEFLHEHFELVQATILDQIRLIKRGEQIPIHTNVRKQILWIKIEEFGGYKSSGKLGIISNDTELEIIENLNKNIENPAIFRFPTLLAVPHSEFTFKCNSNHKLPKICSFKEHSFKVLQDDSVPQNVALVPDLVLSRLFKIVPKHQFILSEGPNSPVSYSNICHYSVDGSDCLFEPSEHLNESIIETSNGIAVKIVKPEAEKNIIAQLTPSEFNGLADFLHKSTHKLILLHGKAGIGKTKNIMEAINQLNYSCDFVKKTVYVDLLTSDFLSIDAPAIIFIDHIDEYLQMESESSEARSIKKYIILCRKISELLLQKGNIIVCVSRSTKVFSNYSYIFSLPFDYIFTFQKSENWDFNQNPMPLNCVHGLEDAKKSLEEHLLNPLQFSAIYKANQMNLYSSVLICGPSGSGKTFLAQKFIEHHNIRSITVRGPEILDKYVGSSERAVRDLFLRARDMKPCVLFFDEIDSLVPKRGSNQSGVTDRIVNQFLTELDGTEDRSGVFIIATTSRPDLIDTAILRPGRIDQKIEVSFPDFEEIKQFVSGKGLKEKKIKSFLNVLRSNPDIIITWADLVSIDWKDSVNPLSQLIQSISVITKTKTIPIAKSQKLTLA